MNIESRRKFLKFMGAHGALLGLSPLLTSCATNLPPKDILGFTPIPPTSEDRLVLATGFQQDVMVRWGDKINAKETFGFNNDYIAFLPQSNTRALMWVNHESTIPLFVSGYDGKVKRTRSQVVLEQKSVGGSIIEIEKMGATWKLVSSSNKSFRVDARTPIPFIANRPIKGSRRAVGTLGNCAGGVTPWGTVLTCEENYQDFYGDSEFKSGKWERTQAELFYWDQFYSYPPEHYGWVVEVDPQTRKSKKLTSLGRFAHESATCIRTKDGRVAVYSGDDKNDECIYKFISDKPDSLHSGELYVADTKNGQWIHMSLQKNPQLKKYFKDQLDLLTYARKAAHELGASRLDRPEDIEIDPKTNDVYITLTNNKPKKNYHGSILKIKETGGDPGALTFTSETFMTGGEHSGFSAPDNLVFDRKGNLWVATDIAGYAVGKPPYTKFKNNGLFYIPLHGPYAGQAFQVASAPTDAEFTGPCFSEDGRTLFVSVQHPGELSKSLDHLTSHWPEGGQSHPKPAVVQIYGEALDRLVL